MKARILLDILPLESLKKCGWKMGVVINKSRVIVDYMLRLFIMGFSCRRTTVGAQSIQVPQRDGIRRGR